MLVIVAINIIVIAVAVSVMTFCFRRFKKNDEIDRKNVNSISTTALEMTTILTKIPVSKVISGNIDDSISKEFEKLEENERLRPKPPTSNGTLQKKHHLTST